MGKLAPQTRVGSLRGAQFTYIRTKRKSKFIIMKTRKSISKRFKITKTGKILRRPTGQDHYLVKKRGKKRRQSRKWVKVSKPEAKKIKKLLKN